jgi:hypothetical protein
MDEYGYDDIYTTTTDYGQGDRALDRWTGTSTAIDDTQMPETGIPNNESQYFYGNRTNMDTERDPVQMGSTPIPIGSGGSATGKANWGFVPSDASTFPLYPTTGQTIASPKAAIAKSGVAGTSSGLSSSGISNRVAKYPGQKPTMPTYAPYTPGTPPAPWSGEYVPPTYTAPAYNAPAYDQRKESAHAQKFANPYLSELRRSIRQAITRSGVSGNPILAKYGMEGAMESAGEGFGKVMSSAGQYGQQAYGTEYGRQLTAYDKGYSAQTDTSRMNYQGQMDAAKIKYQQGQINYQQLVDVWRMGEQQKQQATQAKWNADLQAFQMALKNYYASGGD